MIKIAIVEDEAAVRDQLKDYVRRYTRQYGTEFEVTGKLPPRLGHHLFGCGDEAAGRDGRGPAHPGTGS